MVEEAEIVRGDDPQVEGGLMGNVPPQRSMGSLTLDPEELVDRLSQDLERTISFAEECRWRFPELSDEADQLAAEAMALFGKTMRSLRSRSAETP
jgi:hypothetical protein